MSCRPPFTGVMAAVREHEEFLLMAREQDERLAACVALLVEKGHHDFTCDIFNEQPCTCGWSDALAAVEDALR